MTWPWTLVIPSREASNLVRSARTVFVMHRMAVGKDLEAERVVVVDDGARALAEERLPSGITWAKGEKPFVWARNVNLGIAASPPSEAVLVMGDDVELLTPGGCDLLAGRLAADGRVALVSSAILGRTGNHELLWSPGAGLREISGFAPAILVALSRRALAAVGPFDERFVGYGYDDVDWCRRARKAGFALAVDHAVKARHDGSIPSSYLAGGAVPGLGEINRRIYEDKWAQEG